ncbi:MAG TPA: hypothetical protein DDW52_24125 [Planctomycetaceae bacterium]|nr:hypothetical protein [Planctomycetaceae bacterium]
MAQHDGSVTPDGYFALYPFPEEGEQQTAATFGPILTPELELKKGNEIVVCIRINRINDTNNTIDKVMEAARQTVERLAKSS